MQVWRRGVVIAGVVGALGAGCAGGQRVAEAPPVQSMTLDPMLIQATLENGEVRTVALDAETLFKEATSDFQDRRYDRAIERYKELLKHFPESTLALPSLYNAGLAYERMDRWQDAVELYKQVIARVPGGSEATDALYRSAECYARLGEHAEVVATVDQILGRSGLVAYDRIEAQTRKGDALLKLGRLEEAEAAYQAALRLNKQAPAEEAVSEDTHFVAAAEFGLSQVSHALFERIRFVLPVERMERDIEDKVQLFMQAQNSYIRVMRRGNPYWATAAGFHIGRMYEEFYKSLLAAEIPNDLSDEETRLYFAELRKKTRPLIERAMQVYEKNIIMSERYGITNDFTAQTQENLERLKSYLVDAQSQKAEEEALRTPPAP